MSAAVTAVRIAPDRRRLSVVWDDGRTICLDAEYLRVFSPSAEVRGHGAGERQILPGKRSVTIRDIEVIGAYAIRISFDDGHDTGIYSWDYLADLEARRERYWLEYLQGLDARGLSRD